MINYKTCKIYPNVQIGRDVIIGDFCIIGNPPQGKNSGELKTIIGDNAVIRANTIIYAGNIIGENFQTGHHVTVREYNKIGNNVSIGTSTCVEHHIEIQNNVRIHSQAFIPEYTILEESCWLGPNVVLTNAKYPRSKNVKANLKGAIIRRNAKIGANVTLLPGVIVGENALIGSGTVVIKDVPTNKVIVGNPGKIIKDIRELDEYRRED
ncbi:MAG: transferase [Firmicutes bacterium]|nr:transferase [Bacillota bacterium]